MKTLLKPIILFLILGIVMVSCSKDSDDDTNNNNQPLPPNLPEVNKYMGAASYGDIILYEVDETNNTYTYYNETTNQSGSGSFVISNDPILQGVYEVTIGADKFYGVELADEIFATSLPSGRTENKLSIAISAELDLSSNYSLADLAGKYLCINFDENSYNDSTVWGGLELKADGTYTFSFGPNDPVDFDENKHFAGIDNGTFAVDPNNPSRLIVHSNIDNIDYVGTIYPDKIIVVDNGVGNGFSVGIEYPSAHVSQASVAGIYRFLDITTDGYQGVGYYNIPASGGNLDYGWKYNTPSIPAGTGTATNFAAINQVNNLFECSVVDGNDVFHTDFIILPGEIMLHFCWGENSGLVSYGIGAKIN
ncbi:hypothetical protein ACFLRY_04500 [Bacteroidota bacterium]